MPSFANAQSPRDQGTNILDLEALRIHLETIQTSPLMVAEIDNIVTGLDENVPVSIRIDLDLWKLRALADISDTHASADFAYEIYKSYDREDYASDFQYGDTMQQIVQAVAKTEQLGLAFEIVQHLRESVYATPSAYLSFIIDKSLMEIYIETFDYKRALEIELSILNNETYMSIEVVKNWRPSLYNEIAFLYNRLGNGEKALEYLTLARDSFEKQNLKPNDLLKSRALNAGNRGRAYLLIGKYDQVESLGLQAMKAGEELQQNYLIVLSYRLLGSAAYHQGDYRKALPILAKGIAVSEQHGIATMQKFLYRDYALCLEALGRYKDALFWQKKHFALEVLAQDQAATARDALNVAEFNALESHREIEQLRHENIDQRKITERDKRIKNLLLITILSLLAGAGILGCLLCYMRKSQKKLIQSEKNAQAANKAKGEFLANMSHEIRTPMNGVLGMAQVLERTELTQDQKFYIDIMKQSGESLLFILNDILDVSKLEAKKLKLNPVVCNLDKTLQGVVALLRVQAEEKGLELRYEFDPTLPKYFKLDKDRVRQIITNLVGNAIKFTQQGYVCVHITGQRLDGRLQLKIRIQDTGIGIAEDKQSLIFEKFTQAETSTTRKYGGTGLGLSISLRLAEAMHGKLYAESNLGVGSVFTLELPLEVIEKTPDRSEDKAQSNIGQVTSIQTAKTSRGRRLHVQPYSDIEILIVEDDEIQRTVMKNLLAHPRINITCAKNGEEGVRACRDKRFNLIFMDVSMPVMDGVRATQAIRALEAQEGRERTPIICLSAHAILWQEEKFFQAEIDAYLQKPVQKEQLFKAIRVWLRVNKSAA